MTARSEIGAKRSTWVQVVWICPDASVTIVRGCAERSVTFKGVRSTDPPTMGCPFDVVTVVTASQSRSPVWVRVVVTCQGFTAGSDTQNNRSREISKILTAAAYTCGSDTAIVGTSSDARWSPERPWTTTARPAAVVGSSVCAYAHRA